MYLAGPLHQAGGSSSEFAVLPLAARPEHLIYVTVYTYGDTTGRLDIFPNDAIEAGSSPAGNAQEYNSLAAVSFPAAPAVGAKLALLHGWKASLPLTGNPAYSVRSRIVRLSGAMHQPTGTKTDFAVLPKAARPAHVTYVSVCTTTSPGVLQINTNGQMFAFDANARTLTSLATVSYLAAAAGGHKLTLINGWRKGIAGSPSYSVIGGVVYLSGSLDQRVAGSDEFAVLPPGAGQRTTCISRRIRGMATPAPWKSSQTE